MLLLTDGEQSSSFCNTAAAGGLRMCGTDAAIAIAGDVQPQVVMRLILLFYTAHY